VHAVEEDPACLGRVRAGARGPAGERRPATGAGDAHISPVAERGERFDVVVMDGSDRNAFARRCLDELPGGGVIVVDDTREP
jgi:hypothetical protein